MRIDSRQIAVPTKFALTNNHDELICFRDIYTVNPIKNQFERKFNLSPKNICTDSVFSVCTCTCRYMACAEFVRMARRQETGIYAGLDHVVASTPIRKCIIDVQVTAEKQNAIARRSSKRLACLVLFL